MCVCQRLCEIIHVCMCVCPTCHEVSKLHVQILSTSSTFSLLPSFLFLFSSPFSPLLSFSYFHFFYLNIFIFIFILLAIRQADGTLLNSSATLYVTMLFQFSKVSPIRSRIYGIQDKLRAVEKELNRIKGGKEKENDVY